MAISKKPYGKLKTPIGTALFPWLQEPDTKWKDGGEYKVNLALDAKDAEPLIEQLEKIYETIMADHKSDLSDKKKKTIKEAARPWYDEEDDEDEPTGRTVFKFKSRFKPAMVDSQRNPVSSSTKVYSGSEMRVSSEVAGYPSPVVGVGMILRLNAVQVIRAVGSGGGAADFDVVDDGFVEVAVADAADEFVAAEADY